MVERGNALLKRAAKNIVQDQDAHIERARLHDRIRPLFSEAYQLLDRVLPKKEPSHRDQLRQFSFRVKSEDTITRIEVTVSREKNFVSDDLKIEVDGLGEFLVLHKAGGTVRIPSLDHNTWKTSYEDIDPSLEQAEQYLNLARRIAKRSKVEV